MTIERVFDHVQQDPALRQGLRLDTAARAAAAVLQGEQSVVQGRLQRRIHGRVGVVQLVRVHTAVVELPFTADVLHVGVAVGSYPGKLAFVSTTQQVGLSPRDR